MNIWKELADEGVDRGLLEEIRAFRAAHPVAEEARARVPEPRFLYSGAPVFLRCVWVKHYAITGDFSLSGPSGGDICLGYR